MIRYEDEVKTQVRSNFVKIALPIVIPFYLICNIYDWAAAPAKGFAFLGFRAMLLPLALLFYTAFKKEWKGSWHLICVWSLALFFSLQLILMAHGSVKAESYLISVGLMGGIMMVLFPLPPAKNTVTALCAYAPLYLYLFMGSLSPASRNSVIFQSIGIVVVFIATSVSLDRLRGRTFRQRNDLFMLATTDPLSGLKLRRYFFNRFIQELSLQFRKKEDLFLSVAMVDIDNFKSINDRYGHAAGDRCIRHIGEIIRKSTRIYDVACRFGGEEFVILFPATPLSETAMVCDRIRKSIENSPLQLEKSEIRLTVSIGVSGIAPPVPQEVRQAHFASQQDQKLFLVKSMMRIIKEADKALYEAKAHGRNQVVMGTPADFVTETASDETAIIKQYLVYFEQESLALNSTDGGEEMGQDETFYPPEFFFRRCVESLYRRSRDPEWAEMLTVIHFKKADEKKIKKVFSSLFRLADAVCILESNKIGVLFIGVRPEDLGAIIYRIKTTVRAVPGLEKTEVRAAAAGLNFEDNGAQLARSRKFSLENFSARTEKILSVLKDVRFTGEEDVRFFDSALKSSESLTLKTA